MKAALASPLVALAIAIAAPQAEAAPAAPMAYAEKAHVIQAGHRSERRAERQAE